jgi:hypothetical protein
MSSTLYPAIFYRRSRSCNPSATRWTPAAAYSNAAARILFSSIADRIIAIRAWETRARAQILSKVTPNPSKNTNSWIHQMSEKSSTTSVNWRSTLAQLCPIKVPYSSPRRIQLCSAPTRRHEEYTRHKSMPVVKLPSETRLFCWRTCI